VTAEAAVQTAARVQISYLREVMQALPGLIVVGGAVVLVAFDGAYPPTVWYPVGLFLVTLLCVLLLVGRPVAVPRGIVLALGFYGVFCALSYLSMLWADAPGDAWEGANRIAVYGIAVAIVAFSSWSPAAVRTALALVAFGTTAVAGGVLLAGALGSDPASLVAGGQVSEPVGYSNANANAFLVGLFPALALATASGLAWPLRSAALAAAVVLAQTTLVVQSRGAILAFAAAALLFVLLTPRRWPAIAALALIAGLCALAFDSLEGIYSAERVADLPEAFDAALRAVLLSAAAACVLGAVAAMAGRGAGPALAGRPWIARAGDVGLGAIATVAVAAVLIVIGNPVEWTEERWDDFRNSGYTRVDAEANRLGGSLGSGRYDFYRVALDQFADYPVLGAGPDNFAAAYLLDRRTFEAPRHPHSLAMRLLSQHGLVGTALFVAFLGLLLLAVRRSAKPLSISDRTAVAGAVCGFAAWLVHALGDWLWVFPGMAGMALAMLTMAARVRPVEPAAVTGLAEEERDEAGRPPPALRWVAVLGVVLGLSFAVGGLGARYTSAAYDAHRSGMPRAIDHLERAADLNPWSAEPLIARGVVGRRLGWTSLAAESFRKATEREPKNWFAWLELGMADAAAGRRDAALRHLARAAALNPREEIVRETARRVRRERRVDPAEVERELFSQLRNRLRPTAAAE
jgi:tetratricopeptide (TPR) repeat protein